MARLFRDLPVLVAAAICLPGGCLVGAFAMDAIASRTPPVTEMPAATRPADPSAANPSRPRFATVDVASIVFRGEMRGESFERHRDIVARHGAVIDACIAECKALADEANSEASWSERESYSRLIAGRLDEITVRWESARVALKDEMTAATGNERARVREEVAEVLLAIARREGFALVFNRPYLEGSAVWDEEENVPYAPIAACPDCPDLSVEVAVAVGLPEDVFDDESEFRRTRRELVEEYCRLRRPPPWPEE